MLLQKRTKGRGGVARRADVAERDVSQYYATHFPYEALAAFLCGGEEEWPTRLPDQEFAMFDASGRILDRHARFESIAAWKHAMASHVARIEAGPEHAATTRGYTHAERACYVFDLDIEDYAPVLRADTPPGKHVPMDNDAWTHLVLSARLLDQFLAAVIFRDQPYRAVAVFSGRRGLHLWVPDHHRDWLSTDTAHHVVRAIQNLADSPEYARAAVRRLASSGGASVLADAVAYTRHSLPDHPHIWNRLKSLVVRDHLRRTLDAGEACADEEWAVAAMLFMAPRIDQEVTRRFTHLIKCPLSVHPSTGLVSLPFSLYVAPDLDAIKVRADAPDLAVRIHAAAALLLGGPETAEDM